MFNWDKNLYLHPFSRGFFYEQNDVFIRKLMPKVSGSHSLIGYGDTSGALQSWNDICRDYAASLLKHMPLWKKLLAVVSHLLVSHAAPGLNWRSHTGKCPRTFHTAHSPAQGSEQHRHRELPLAFHAWTPNARSPIALPEEAQWTARVRVKMENLLTSSRVGIAISPVSAKNCPGLCRTPRDLSSPPAAARALWRCCVWNEPYLHQSAQLA